jgi:hypothetical protein
MQATIFRCKLAFKNQVQVTCYFIKYYLYCKTITATQHTVLQFVFCL